MDDVFRADLDELRDVVRRLDAARAGLEDLAQRLDQRLALLHQHWDGAAAGAHDDAQARWDSGFGAMRDALSDMRSVIDGACAHYSCAADTNATMWRRLG